MTATLPPPTTNGSTPTEPPLPVSGTTRPEIAEARLIAFIERPPKLQLHRMWFSEVKARWWTGHVQGVAAHHDGVSTTLYASLSDFPRGWGAALINDNRQYADGEPVWMEAMAFPQGRHPGGITVCEDYLAVPIEMGDRPGRVYIYAIDEPLYPRQVGHVEGWIDGCGLATPEDCKAKNEKASAVGMTRIGDNDYLVVVLSQNRYLRFLHLRRTVDPIRGVERFTGRQTGFLDGRDLHPDGWPGGFTDNLSLVRTDRGIHVVLFSIEQWFSVGPLVVPKIRRSSIHRLTSFRIEPGTELDEMPTLTNGADGFVDLPDRQGLTDWLRPGFRWGASLGVYGGEPGLITAEYFGSERSANHPAQYLQVAANIDTELLNWSVGVDDDLIHGIAGAARRRLATRVRSMRRG